jgi:mono/diheme cytochrome c family protein
MRPRPSLITGLLLGLLLFVPLIAQDNPGLAPTVSYLDTSHATLLLDADGKRYLVDVAAGTVRPAEANAPRAAALFAQNCSGCHGTDGKGIRAIGTPNFTDPSVQASLSNEQIAAAIRDGKADKMPRWSGRLTDTQITELAAHIRSFAASSSAIATGPSPSNSGVYQPGDDMLFTLPTGRPVDRHGVYVNFTHRFAYDPTFTGPGANLLSHGQELFGLDNFALSSLGVRYGVTSKLSVDIWRSPSFIGRPIQLMAAYNLLEESNEAPLNLAVRISVEGQNNFRKNFTENIEAVISRSLTSRAQIYLVPTLSFNDRRLVQGGLLSQDIPDLPGVNAFSLGVGLAWDIRPTVALLAEVMPTLANARELGIHRPPFSFAIQKKIYRHAFTFGVTTSPGTTVSQRAGTRATLIGDPSADTPAGLFLGFDLTRQLR